MKLSLIHTGTEIEEPQKRLLKAGALEATFDQGGLRWIKWNGLEILRAVTFLVRTPGWGTPAPRITALEITEQTDHFAVRYDAHYGEPEKGVLARISLEGTADGRLHALADITAEAPFSTNRTGLVILHPLVGFAGTEVEVEHASSGSRNPVIPLRISPGQPLMDIRAITHSPRGGLHVSTRMEGDIFEMEDHRNWSDASFKTYSRPIGLPYPYLLQPGEPARQAVVVTVTDDGSAGSASDPIPLPRLEEQVMPAYSLPLDRPEDAVETLRFASTLAELAPASVLLRFDPSRGDNLDSIGDVAKLLQQTGASLELTVLLSGDDQKAAAAVLKELAEAFDRNGVTVARIAAFAKIDEQSFQPDEPRPLHLREDELASMLSEIFPASLRGGGTPAFFTEFNRKRPNPALADYLTFATTPVVHAADDASVTETLESLPHILNSARELAQGRPLAVGPVGIGARLNPYGPGPVDNAPDERAGMAARDPRQRGLFAAAWHVGYLARIAHWNVERFAFGASTGPFGLVSSPQPYGRDGWDEWPAGTVYPLFHVARWVSKASGGRIAAAWTRGNVAHVAWEKNGRRFALFANLASDRVTVELTNDPGAVGSLLDAESFETAARDPAAFVAPVPLGEAVRLGANAVLHVEYGVAT